MKFKQEMISFSYKLIAENHVYVIEPSDKRYIESNDFIDKANNHQIFEGLIEKADLLISPNSTTVVEAAFLRKKAIQLGELGTTLKLPNVFKHTDMTTLSVRIKEVLTINLETEEYERKLENFVAAVYDTGFNFKYLTVWEKGRGDNMEDLWRVYKKEIERVLFNRA